MFGIILNGMPPEELTRAGGGHRIATHLRRLGWKIEVIDYFASWNLQDLNTFISITNQKEKIDWIGFSTTWTFSHSNLKSLINYIRKHFPDIKILVGGNNVFSHDIGADYYVYGFGEYAVESILKYEFSNGQIPIGKPFYNGLFIDAVKNYPAWPLPDYLNEYQINDFLDPNDLVTLEFGRGCRFKCKFCNFPVLGVKDDTSMSESIMYNYFSRMYDQWGVKNYVVGDETINERTSKLEKIANAVKRCSFDPNFTGFIRLDLFNSHPEQIELLAQARIWGQYYGIETFNHNSGKIIGKGLHPDIVKEYLLKTKKYFLDNLGLYRGTSSFIAGLPYETEDSLLATYNWLVENWIDQSWNMNCLMIPTGTDTRLSAFGENLSNYNYEIMTQDQITEFIESTKLRYNGGKSVWRGLPHIIWKNDLGNMLTFTDIAHKLDGETAGCKDTNWDVFEFLARGVTPADAISCGISLADEDNLAKIRQNNYIQQKLNSL